MPPVRMKGDGRKAKNPTKTLARLLSYLKPYKKTMILVVVCILVSSLATAYVADGMFEDAITEARLALEKDENHASSLATCAICYGVLDDSLLYKHYTDKAVDNGYSADKISTTVTVLKKKYKKTLEAMR